MQFEMAVAGAQRRPLGLGFLHPVFPEHALAGGNHRLDRIGAEGLCNRDQCHARRIASGVAAGAGDFGANCRKPIRSIYAFHFVNARNGSNFNGGPKIVFTHFSYVVEHRGWGSTMSDVPAESAKASRPNKPILSIRARLIVVALLALAPLMLERMRGLEQARAEHAELARGQVIDLAQSGVEAQREIVNSMRALLQVVARVYTRMAPDQSDCNQTLADLTSNIPWLTGVAVAGRDGRIKCETDPRAVGLNVSDRPYFQNTLRSHDFALSDYLINRFRQAPALFATFPVVKDDGALTDVVFASINLNWIGKLAATAARREGTSMLLVDGSGTLIAASTDEGEIVGKNFADNALVREMLAKDEGTMTIAGLDASAASSPMSACLGRKRGLPSASTSASFTVVSTATCASPTCSWRWSPC
jgi:hypothetical protein